MHKTLLLLDWFIICNVLCLVIQSCPTLVTAQTMACKAPLSMGFSRQEYLSGLPFPSPIICRVLTNSIKLYRWLTPVHWFCVFLWTYGCVCVCTLGCVYHLLIFTISNNYEFLNVSLFVSILVMAGYCKFKFHLKCPTTLNVLPPNVPTTKY